VRRTARAGSRRCGDPKVTLRRAADVGDQALGVLERTQHVLARIVENQPVLGRLHLARGAIEQPDPEVGLELLQAMADHGRRQAEVAPGGGQAAELHHPHVDANVLE
jgi:hypothetical protein